ncbi:MAG: Ig-like domain-containing protein, partial [Prevotellaceae bacterium]|nr:Ig-like domain-containing protein [Prevotellaceae bacterium]
NLTVNNILVDEANIYASELNVSTVDNVEYTFKYTLNAKASSLVINILDAGNAIVKTIPITSAANRTLGVHEFKANVTGLSVGTYKWEITATGAIRANSTTAPTKVSNDDLQFKFTDARSIAVDNSFDSPFFGRIYICDAQGTGAGSAGEGIYILNAALSDTTNQNGNGYKGGVAWVTTSSPFRASVAPDGNVYIADWSDAHTGVWKMDAANPTAPFTPVFGGTRDAGGLSSEGGVNIHGSISHCWVIDTGVNTKLYTFDEDYVDAAVIDKGSLLQYNIGNLSTPWAQAPSAVVYNDALYGNLQQNMNSCIVPDGIGGWWISQNRATNATNIPSLVHLNDQATLTNFGSNTNIVSSAQGGLAVSADGTQIAVGGQGIVKIFDVTFDVNNIPTLSLVYTISTSALGTNTHGLAFDNANNIYVAASANNTTLATRVGVWALPVANNSFTTPAPFTSVLEVIATAKPTVVSTTPANGETGVSISLNSVSVTFSQEINTGVTGTVQIINTTTSAVTGTVSSPIWSNNNTTVTFTYSGTLGYGVNYTIKVSDFENTTGNVMDDDATNSFTTIDLQLAVVSTTPANGTINVPVNLSEVSVIFNKEMDITTIGTVELVAGGVAVGTLSSPQWRTIDNKAITFTSTSTLDYATTYTINISGFKDNGGALMTGTNSDNSFTTETAPEVTLYVNKDYNAWLTHGKTFTLQQNGQVKYTGVDNLDGTVTFTAVVDGFYRLYDGANNLRDEVIQGVTSIGLSYYTIKFGLQNDGKASGSTINATYNDNAVSSGDVVISGRKLVLVAVGNGANRYTYTWRGSWNGNVNASITGDVLSVDIVDNIVDVHCTINGLGDEIILPKVVTPNMDGANDFFYVQGLEAYPSNELRIFNRSGTEVFRAKNYKNNTWSGSDLPDDVYFFSLGLIDENGALTTKTGYVHLKK